MYDRSKLISTEDRLAWYLSEIHNDAAPIGWQRYRGMAALLLRRFPEIKERVNSSTFFDEGE